MNMVFKNVKVIVFHLKIYQNNIFFILKKLFLTLAYQNNLKLPKTKLFEVKKH